MYLSLGTGPHVTVEAQPKLETFPRWRNGGTVPCDFASMDENQMLRWWPSSKDIDAGSGLVPPRQMPATCVYTVT